MQLSRPLVLSLLVGPIFGGAVALAVVVGPLTASACQSQSETPNAYFGRDGGPGDNGQLCRSGNTCNEITLACVDEDSDGPLPPTCRLTCVTDDNDPCGAGFRCIALGAGTDGACLQANALSEACTGRCDDTLICIDDGADAGTGTCFVECTPVDGGPCPNAAACTPSGQSGFCP